MTNNLTEFENIIARLSLENKKYVLAVANALLFSQSKAEHSEKFANQTTDADKLRWYHE